MGPNPILGVTLHAIGGLAAASFYIPYKKVKGWSWERYWLTGGFFSWIIVPWIVALIAVPETMAILKEAPRNAMLWAFIFGLMWGVGGLTFGLSMRYLGIALGYAVALGFCAAFGTIMPPLFKGELGAALQHGYGIWQMVGVVVCLLGITFSGMAGSSKEREQSDEEKKKTIGEFNFSKGLAVAIFAGILSASMNYGFEAGAPIAKLALKHHAPDLFQNTPVFVVILLGGFITNGIWCGYLLIRNRSAKPSEETAPSMMNLIFCALAGATWYFQFMFYGMGSTKMGPFNFSSWTLHMSFIIIFSTLWGIAMHEWRGAGAKTRSLVALGLTTLVLSTVVIGYGNYLKPKDETPVKGDAAHQTAPINNSR